MLEFIGGAVLVYFLFRLLDALFRRKPEDARGQFMVKGEGGQYYLVREVEQEQETKVSNELPENVIQLASRKSHARK